MSLQFHHPGPTMVARVLLFARDDAIRRQITKERVKGGRRPKRCYAWPQEALRNTPNDVSALYLLSPQNSTSPPIGTSIVVTLW